MKLKEILQNVSVLFHSGNLEIEINGIENDSRKIVEGNLFVAVKGYEVDGHHFCKAAVQNGAKAILLEDKDPALEQELTAKGVTLIQVKDSRKALGEVAASFYNHPAKRMNMVGITGTNGKTSTSLLSYAVLEENNHRVGVVGTISNRIHKMEIPTERTTPEAHELQRLFAQMIEHRVDTAVMEVSSHALALHRVDEIPFKIGVFTNLSLDHLDFHETMENYKLAKKKLFSLCEIGIINADDPVAEDLLADNSCQKVLRYSMVDASADYFAKNIKHEITGTEYQLSYQGEEYAVRLQTPGNFSVYNSLAAIAIATQLEVSMKDCLDALQKHSLVRGRFETVVLPNGSTAVVDYAHTPDGLENVLKSIHEFKKGRVITVFGCGGDRDKTKRPIMAQIAERYSDYIYITSDNPRTEDPLQILKDIEAGVKGDLYECEVDRKAAILKALQSAKQEDVILIAGKGHEDYQIIGKEKIHFDDVEIVKEWRNTNV